MSIKDDFRNYVINNADEVYLQVLNIAKSSNRYDSCLMGIKGYKGSYHIMGDSKGSYELLESPYKTTLYNDLNELFRELLGLIKGKLDKNYYFRDFKNVYDEVKGYNHSIFNKFDITTGDIRLDVPTNQWGRYVITLGSSKLKVYLSKRGSGWCVSITVFDEISGKPIDIYYKQLTNGINKVNKDELDLVFDECATALTYYLETITHINKVHKETLTKIKDFYLSHYNKYLDQDV